MVQLTAYANRYSQIFLKYSLKKQVQSIKEQEQKQ